MEHRARTAFTIYARLSRESDVTQNSPAAAQNLMAKTANKPGESSPIHLQGRTFHCLYERRRSFASLASEIARRIECVMRAAVLSKETIPSHMNNTCSLVPAAMVCREKNLSATMSLAWYVVKHARPSACVFLMNQGLPDAAEPHIQRCSHGVVFLPF